MVGIAENIPYRLPRVRVSWFFPAFTPWDDVFVSGRGTLHRNADGTVDCSTLDTRFLLLNMAGDELDPLVSDDQLCFPFAEIPQGARVSPDGRWLVFFAQSTPDVQGLYLYDLDTDALYRLSTTRDRDPTWAANGHTIFLHELPAAGSATRVARLGRMELELDGAELSFTRSLLEPSATETVHQEHAAPVFRSDVMLLHAQDSADSTLYLAARRTRAGFDPVPMRELGIIIERSTPEVVITMRELTSTHADALHKHAKHVCAVDGPLPRVIDLTSLSAAPLRCRGMRGFLPVRSLCSSRAFPSAS